MSEAVIIALISGLCVGIPSVITTLLSNRSNNKLTLYRIDKLEDKVDKHNSVIERTFKLEEKIEEITNDIKELKSYHKPN
jgi:uncharacterized membrane-anchored protein YhcB (DUF1043 family)